MNLVEHPCGVGLEFLEFGLVYGVGCKACAEDAMVGLLKRKYSRL